ncbi:tryptophan synthase subunit alpha [Amnibacterium kyonggiense]|uniref:Tryptophan synthase alpha chain n=1 Tax=Amnibacterium kyonggiense TaxID=595671 RepID=A0A4R7FLW2_9MICO|nr:tryptophan synthase subunit alpha [Amnibacterium kyonggiense]TDS77415.1 tryptophan synthase alpha chain [Amnibacterium kyonggiense]
MTPSKVEAAFAAASDAGSGPLVGYLPIGYPDLATSIEAAITLTQHGVDVLELGIPYSDPVIDGPTIQAATTVALENGFRLRHAFEAVREISRASAAPALCMTYYNPVLSYGVDRFAADLAAAGGAGLITPDLVPEEAGEWVAASDAHGLDRVFLAAPTSPEARLRAATEVSRGFTYVVSTMGITGARADVDSAARTLVERLRAVTERPLAVGIGISTGAQVAEVLTYADGAIVGSRLVTALGQGLSALADAADELAEGKRPVVHG